MLAMVMLIYVNIGEVELGWVILDEVRLGYFRID